MILVSPFLGANFPLIKEAPDVGTCSCGRRDYTCFVWGSSRSKQFRGLASALPTLVLICPVPDGHVCDKS